MADNRPWPRRPGSRYGVVHHGVAGMTVSQAELLKELRIEKHQRDDHRGGPARWPWIVLAVALLLALVGSAVWWATSHRAIAVQTTGTLTAVLIEEGDRVKKGQVLARLDDSAYKAALDAVKAQAAAAHALVAQYQAQLAQNERDATRQQSLAARGLVPKQTAEQARTLVDSTRAQLVSQQKQVAAADAQVVEAQVNFDYCVIRAPFDGVITTKDAQVGEI